MQRKSLVVASVFLTSLPAFLLTLTGCQRRVVDAPPPYHHVQLRVAVPNAASEALVREAARGWQLRQQARPVEIVRFDDNTGPEAVSNADIWVLRPAELGRWAEAQKLLLVPDKRLEDQVWTGLLPLYRDKLLVWRENGNHRAAYAYPLLGEAPLLFWRGDVVGPATRREPPQTWTELRDQAAALFAESGKPPLPPLPEEEDELERLFYTVAASYVRRALAENGRPERVNDFAFHFDLDTGEPLINKEGFVRALELLRDLQAYRPGNAVGSPEDAFRQAKGPTIYCVTDAAFLGGFGANPVGLGPVPGATRGNRVPYLGSASWIGVVPKSTAQADAAFDLLADIAGPETSNLLALSPHRDPAWGGGLLRIEQFDSTVRLESFEQGNAAAVEELRKTLQWTLRSGAQNPVLPLRIPDQQRYRPVLIRQLRAALGPPGSRPSAKDALDAVAAEWKRIGAESDLTRRTEVYRVSVGLSAR